MKLTAILLSLTLSAAVQPGRNPLVERRTHPTYTEEITFINKRREIATVRTFTLSGQRITEEHYANYEKGEKHGLTRCWYPNGQTYWYADFKHGEMHGPLLVYHPDGSTKRREYFKHGYSRESQCFGIDGEPYSCDAFAKPADHPGTEKEYLAALEEQLSQTGFKPINETQLITFHALVEEDGSLGVVTIQPADHALATPLRLALNQLTQWKPATVDNKPVAAQYSQKLFIQGRDIHIARFN